jgi:cytochrome c peroxidase
MKIFKPTYLFILMLLFSTALLNACKKDVPFEEEDDEITKNQTPFFFDVPIGFPLPNIPEDNPMTIEKIALGRRMFFDKSFSRNNTISCGSCHLPNLAFSDGLPQSVGIEGRIGPRNAPTMINVAYIPKLFMEGGVPNLDILVLAPIENHDEMDFHILEVAERLKTNQYYVHQIKKIFNREPDAYSITRALGAYQRSLVRADSRFDDFYYNKNQNALNEQEKRGLALFFNAKTQCSTCHSLPHFSNFGFENIGLYSDYADMGKALATGKTEDIGKFKVPTLRNIEITAPYMHNGSMNTLEEVVEHFNSGGNAHANKSHLIKPLNLNQQEKEDLISFMKTLTNKTQFTGLEK